MEGLLLPCCFSVILSDADRRKLVSTYLLMYKFFSHMYVFVRISIHISKKLNLVSLKLEFSSILIWCFLEDKTRNMMSEYVYVNFFRHSIFRSYWKLFIATKSADKQGYLVFYILMMQKKVFLKKTEWIIFFGICLSECICAWHITLD